jgi:hypothetical protein
MFKLKKRKMKKLIIILLAITTFSCGDGTNRSSERKDELDTDLNNREELLEPDTTGMTDTTSTGNTDGVDFQRDSL